MARVLFANIVIRLDTEEVFVEVRDEKGRIYPRVGKKLWFVVKKELGFF